MDEQRLQRVPDVLVHELDGELLLLRAGGCDVLHLDAVASDVWRALEPGPTPGELASGLADAYGVDAAVVAVDLAPVLDLLRDHGVVDGPAC